MDNSTKYSNSELEKCSYRFLQQKAKALQLPSNVKKIYLIQLIYTKTYGTAAEVESIIQDVKRERQQTSQLRKKTKSKNKKMRLQAEEISSTSISRSPPITLTPKRTNPIIVRCSPLMRQTLLSYRNAIRPRTALRTTSTTTRLKTYSPKMVQSQRVLRNRTYSIPKVNQTEQIFNINNSVISVVNGQKVPESNFKGLKVYRRNSEVKSLLNANQVAVNKCVLKHRPSILATLAERGRQCVRNENMPIMTSVTGTSPIVPAKRKRKLSGIYPINPVPKTTYEYIQGNICPITTVPKTNYKYIQGDICPISTVAKFNYKYVQGDICPVSTESKSNFKCIQSHIEVRNQDGTYSKITGFVQKPHKTYTNTAHIQISDVNSSNEIEFPITSTIENSIIEHQKVAANFMLDTPFSNFDENQDIDDFYTRYCHKKIRAEQVRSRLSPIAYRRDSVDGSLPRIHEAFSMFSHVGAANINQPIYEQVNHESENSPNYRPLYTQTNTTSGPLEMLYNYKSIGIQAISTANTYCVYSTPLVVSAMVHEPASNAHAVPPNVPNDGFRHDSYSTYLSMWEQDLALREMRLRQGLNQSLGTEMLMQAPRVGEGDNMHDALELISQDGDYMERIGMDERIQCAVCTWAGPSMILDHHIRNEHENRILRFNAPNWNVCMKLGALLRAGSISEIVERDSALFVLTAYYQDPDVCVLLSSISECTQRTGSITLYNKVSGEPYRWSGTVPQLVDTDAHCDPLKVNLSKLKLLPHSANLNLNNSQLVSNSPANYLDDIHLIIFVNL